MATKVIATATVRAVKRKLIPMRAAITLVRGLRKFLEISIICDFVYL